MKGIVKVLAAIVEASLEHCRNIEKAHELAPCTQIYIYCIHVSAGGIGCLTGAME